jgi:hypothetical protein
MTFVDWLAAKWAVNDPLPRTCDLLVPVAHGATKDRLSIGAENVARRTAEALTQLRNIGQLPFVAFGAFTGSENPELERTIKLTIFTGKYIGQVMSTIEECWKVKQGLPEFFNPATIVVVTDEAHSRRCRIVWRTFFPNSDIKIVSVKLADTIDSESPMSAYGNPWKILFFQAAPTPVWWAASLFGEKVMLRIGRYHTHQLSKYATMHSSPRSRRRGARFVLIWKFSHKKHLAGEWLYR